MRCLLILSIAPIILVAVVGMCMTAFLIWFRGSGSVVCLDERLSHGFTLTTPLFSLVPATARRVPPTDCYAPSSLKGNIHRAELVVRFKLGCVKLICAACLCCCWVAAMSWTCCDRATAHRKSLQLHPAIVRTMAAHACGGTWGCTLHCHYCGSQLCCHCSLNHACLQAQ